MKSQLFILFTFITAIVYSQPTYVPTRILGRQAEQFCENEIKVKDAKPASCAADNCHSYLFPVIVEDFDNMYDIPNKWRFDYGYTQAIENTWYGYGFYNSSGVITNNNVQISGGTMKLINKYENNSIGGTSYDFTNGMIRSLNRFEYGTFEARIKVPSANKMWPAFWLLGELGKYSEIDIFEFYDNNVSGTPCELYNEHKMATHVGSIPNKNECHRSEKYPISIDVFHTYKLEWGKYEVKIFVDGTLKGYATKFYDGNVLDVNCNYSSAYNNFDPRYNFDCNGLRNLNDNIYQQFWPQKPNNWPSWLPWPNMPSWLYYPNKIREDSYFPSRDRQMGLIINNIINNKYKTENFSEFSQAAQTMEIDWVKIYQPFCCGEDKTIYLNSDFAYLTNWTNILTGRKLKFGNVNTSQFSNYVDMPVFLLATDEIEINSESIFGADVYAEMRITNCNGTGGARLADQSTEINGSSDENEISKPENIASNARLSENIVIDVYPIPATDEVNIKCDTETFEKISSFYLVDINGNKFEISKSATINMESFSAGCYQLMIRLKNNSIIYKKIIKL
ncbi:MAG: family 16 glycosylhydrolase [Bacteroidota bacterium]